MRDINIFKYNNRTFKCWDILVKDFYLFLKNPEETYKRLLLEFNEKVPKLTPWQKEKFTGILLLSENDRKKEDSDKKKPIDLKKAMKKIDIFEKEFHISAWFVSKTWWFTRNDIMNMPYFVFKRYYDDIAIITWKKEYDPQRSDMKLDKKSLNEVLNNKKVLKSNGI